MTATEREVAGWRVAAAMTGEKLADWAVGALNEAARATIAAREGAAAAESPAVIRPRRSDRPFLALGGRVVDLDRRSPWNGH